MPWQVIDTPGILDHALEERNTIEMQSVMALAHLQASILFLIDCSGECGYSVAQQVSLFKSIKALFVDKPLFVVATKTDVKKPADLDAEDKALLAEITAPSDVTFMQMSTYEQEGVVELRNAACDALLAKRLDNKMRSKTAREMVNMVHVAQPKVRDARQRPAMAPPAAFLAQKAQKAAAHKGQAEKPRTLLDEQVEAGGPGLYKYDHRREYIVEHEEWRNDVMPEFYKGVNVADWIDPEIEEKLAKLEAEEEVRLMAVEAERAARPAPLIDEATEASIAEMRRRRLIARQVSRVKRNHAGPQTPHGAILTARAKPRPLPRPQDDDEEPEDMDVDMSGRSRKRKRSVVAFEGAGKMHDSESYASTEAKMAIEKDIRRKQRRMQQQARAGESDRRHFNWKPKHLNSGKRGAGSTDRR